jgi:hypothetical protein
MVFSVETCSGHLICEAMCSICIVYDQLSTAERLILSAETWTSMSGT